MKGFITLPIEYWIDPVAMIIHEKMIGEITAADIRDSVARREADPLWQKDMNGLTDLSNATPMFSSNDVHSQTKHHAHSVGLGCERWALVAQGKLQFGMSRIMQAMSEAGPTEVRIFRNQEDAINWVRSG